MKKVLTGLVFGFVMILTFVGCNFDQLYDSQANSRIFRQLNDELTDGTMTYKRFPDHWEYIGKYPLKIGTVQGGNALYTSDKEGTFVQEAKPWYSGMNLAPWVRTDLDIPNVPSKESEIRIAIYKGASFYLSSKAREEFITWYLMYMDGQIQNFGATYEQPFASIYFTMVSVPELQYDGGYCLVQGEESLVITNSSGQILGLFDSNSAVYQEIMKQRNY